MLVLVRAITLKTWARVAGTSSLEIRNGSFTDPRYKGPGICELSTLEAANIRVGGAFLSFWQRRKIVGT